MARLFHRDEELLKERAQRATFVEVSDEPGLDAVLGSAHALLFLHDPYCPISNAAFEEVEQVAGDVHLLDVSARSALGKLVQQKTGIRHESPQAIVIAGGKPAWHASHGRIRRETVEAALQD